jgi:hypothetical protein
VALGRAGARYLIVDAVGNAARQLTFDPADDDNPGGRRMNDDRLFVEPAGQAQRGYEARQRSR